mgnify:FL=1
MDIKDIKFRAKTLALHTWAEGDLLHKNGRTYIRKDKVIFADVDPDTVCMFTGLKDCEGNEIWEGDILQDVDYYYIKYVVIFGEGTFFARKEGYYTGIPLHECVGDLGNVTYAKVVGNKFDR